MHVDGCKGKALLQLGLTVSSEDRHSHPLVLPIKLELSEVYSEVVLRRAAPGMPQLVAPRHHVLSELHACCHGPRYQPYVSVGRPGAPAVCHPATCHLQQQPTSAPRRAQLSKVHIPREDDRRGDVATGQQAQQALARHREAAPALADVLPRLQQLKGADYDIYPRGALKQGVLKPGPLLFSEEVAALRSVRVFVVPQVKQHHKHRVVPPKVEAMRCVHTPLVPP
mmetsp:Transcript_80851/g.223648  ORF Transcript_80851/g.223648 Transcript_80851/m.223648 type:complete len:225 (-) Transcript_80851:403-1077(-)